MKFLGRLLINALALVLADRIVDGITLSDSLISVLLVALIFGLVNALVRPFAILLSLPALLLTLGLFMVIVNAAMLAVTAWLSDSLAVDGFGSALLGALVISAVSWLFSFLSNDENQNRDQREAHRDGPTGRS